MTHAVLAFSYVAQNVSNYSTTYSCPPSPNSANPSTQLHGPRKTPFSSNSKATVHNPGDLGSKWPRMRRMLRISGMIGSFFNSTIEQFVALDSCPACFQGLFFPSDWGKSLAWRKAPGQASRGSQSKTDNRVSNLIKGQYSLLSQHQCNS